MTPEQKENYLKMHNAAIRLRGVMIQNLTYLERCIEECISSHFCSSDQKLRIQLMEYIICPNRLNFKHKKDILKGIIENTENNYNSVSEKYPSLFNDIDTITIHRNIFAHNLLDTSPEALEKFKETEELKFVTITYKPNRRKEIYTKELFESLLAMSNNCVIAFRDILGLNKIQGLEV